MPIHRVNKKTGKKEWYGKVRLPNGKTTTKKCQTRGEAQEWEVTIRASLVNLSEIDTISLLALTEQYLDHVKINRTDRHYKDVALVLGGFVRKLGPETQARDINRAMVYTYVMGVAGKKSNNRANRAASYIKAMYNWAIKYLEFGSPNPCRVDKLPTDRPKQPMPTLDEFWAIHEVADEQQKNMLVVYLCSAARRTELLRLKWEDVNFMAGTIVLTTRKRKGGEEADKVHLHPDAIEALEAQYMATGDMEYVFINPKSGTRFQTADHMIRNLCKKAGLTKNFGFHGIRRLSASIMADKVGLKAAQEQLRHKNLTTTAVYVQQLNGNKLAVETAFSEVFSDRPKVRTTEMGAQAGA